MITFHLVKVVRGHRCGDLVETSHMHSFKFDILTLKLIKMFYFLSSLTQGCGGWSLSQMAQGPVTDIQLFDLCTIFSSTGRHTAPHLHMCCT